MVIPKKRLGQHFLTDTNIAQQIVHLLSDESAYSSIIEIGPGMGVLTQFLIKKHEKKLILIEIDSESVDFLTNKLLISRKQIVEADFLSINLDEKFTAPVAIIGNFPYNISSQILFKVFEYKNMVGEVVGMFQKEVAERIASPPGSKKYGILSVLLQAFYTISYEFTVNEQVFNPPPKVKSGVIRLVRNPVKKLDCEEKLFRQVVKMSFNQRRKTLNNSLKRLLQDKKINDPIMKKRPEQLSVEEFVGLTNLVSNC